MSSSCCHQKKDDDHKDHCETKRSFDFILWGSTGVILLALLLNLAGLDLPYLHVFAHAATELLSTMWWGIVLGLVFVGLMSKIRKEYFQAILGRGDTYGGIVRAAIAGLFLDLCSHGILMVGAKLYERGASVAQIMTFLIASPWNSVSLTIILIALIGWKWTLIFVIGSAVIAILTGIIFKILTDRGVLPENQNTPGNNGKKFDIWTEAKADLKGIKLSPTFFKEIAMGGMHEARMLLRWLLLGVVIASAVRAFIPPEIFVQWFGPSLFGLFLTLAATTVIEVCSEGSSPIAAEIMNSAAAPGNAFAFLMAGVSTDYTEIMVLKDTTKSWKVALFLPLVTVPQVMVIGYIMNLAGS